MHYPILEAYPCCPFWAAGTNPAAHSIPPSPSTPTGSRSPHSATVGSRDPLHICDDCRPLWPGTPPPTTTHPLSLSIPAPDYCPTLPYRRAPHDLPRLAFPPSFAATPAPAVIPPMTYPDWPSRPRSQ